jgi:hypothetical protein
MAQRDPAEAAVRTYLLFLEDPAKVIDAKAVDKLQLALANAVDPLDKLKAVTALERGKHGDEVAYREGFIAHAKAWADDNQVPARSFEVLGVSADVLRQAGLLTAQTRPGSRRSRSGAGGQKSKTKTVTAETIKAVLASWTTEFTLADVATTIGGSPMTIRKAVDDLVRSGVVIRLGPTPNWTHQGRAPILFRPAAARKAR